MEKAILVCLVLMLTACANLNRPTADQQFESFRSEVRAQRDAGEITSVEEQEKLRDRYWEIYGQDSDSASHFAFSILLMRRVQAGHFPMQEAQSLIDKREEQMFAMRKASRQREIFCTYDCPWN